jgi:hypothetical protein
MVQGGKPIQMVRVMLVVHGRKSFSKLNPTASSQRNGTQQEF